MQVHLEKARTTLRVSLRIIPGAGDYNCKRHAQMNVRRTLFA